MHVVSLFSGRAFGAAMHSSNFPNFCTAGDWFPVMPSCITSLVDMCSPCGEEATLDDSLVVQKENVITGAKEQRRHNKCNSLQSRIRRALKHLSEEKQEGYFEMNHTDRKDFYKRAQGMCGAELEKEITESVTMSTIRRITEASSENGNFEPLDEVKTEWAKKRPEALKNLLEHAPRMTCTFTKQELIDVPSYSYKCTAETLDETKSKRAVESKKTEKTENHQRRA